MRSSKILSPAALAMLAMMLAGCIATYAPYSAAGGGTDTVLGEQHDTPYPAQDTFVMTQDVLRGEGVLFEVRPNDHVVTNWRPTDKGAGVFGSLLGVNPQYRYDIEVVPTGTRTSRIVANLQTQDMPDSDLNAYLPTKRLDLFGKFDQLAANLPPPSPTPREGGVNFALLPGEDLPALAKRTTGNEKNWRQIAKDNGLESATELSGIETIWVRDNLLPARKGSASAP
ncbi:MAG TPA: hypothetical protein VNF29_01635 [Candidatus Binataceae bacterium]|nr:hypothetical protein [Candidatus Binataceae bacterium]